MNYHLEVSTISRHNPPHKTATRSVARAFSYICGETVHDKYSGKTYRYHRTDLVGYEIYLPGYKLEGSGNLQRLCDEINKAEKRKDARTGRQFIGSLPNELPPREWTRIVEEFIEENFTAKNLCAVAAIHRGKLSSKQLSNPHVHIIVSTRTVGPDGFNPKKDREHDKRSYIEIWRRSWADVQNRAYERYGMKVRVSHLSYEVQGIDKEGLIHLHISDWKKEMRGQRTDAGDRRRRIEMRNQEREQYRDRENDLTRSR